MIAFQSARALDGSDAANTTIDLWVMNPDGSGAAPLTKVTAAGAVSQAPTWSPDGSKIAFISDRAVDGSNALNTNSTFNLWVINADGSGATPLTKMTAAGADSVGFAWSPDGGKIMFGSFRALDGTDAVNANGTFNIWVVNADGSGATPLTRLTAKGTTSNSAVWSPDASKIAFESQRALDGSDATSLHSIFNVWVMNADGSGAAPLTKLTATGAGSLDPVWSPDGAKLAFDSPRALDGSDAPNTNGAPNIWVMNADGSNPSALTKLTAAGEDSFVLLWSPSGGKLAFNSTRAVDGSDAVNLNKTFNLWVMNPDGSGLTPVTKLTAAGASSFDAVWSPDGSRLFFDSTRALDGSDAKNTNSTSNIWVVNADGSGAAPLTKITATGADSQVPNRP
jgi:Tol biopolymer transport system component